MRALAPELMPALCRHCGGPSLVQEGELRCPYCGQRERLPEDRAALVLDLERRVVIAASAAFQAAGTVRALAGLFERPAPLRRTIAAIVLAGVVLSAILIAESISAWSALPPDLRRGALTAQLFTPALLFSGAIGLVVGSAVGRFRYRVAVKPFLIARAPRFEGGAARCRVCGADLPGSPAPIVRCHFCSTESIVSADLYAQRVDYLEREQSEQLRRARGVSPAAQRIARWIGAAMALAFLLSLLGAVALLWLLSATLGI